MKQTGVRSADLTPAVSKVRCPCVGVSHVPCSLARLTGEALLSALKENA